MGSERRPTVRNERRASSMTDFFEVLFAQRAHRALRPDPIPEALLERLLDAAIRAPSAENRQPWVFVVVRDPAQRDRIATLVREFWETVARDLARPHLSDWLYADVDRWATSGLAQAPVIVVVCGDTALCMEAALPSSIFPANESLLKATSKVRLPITPRIPVCSIASAADSAHFRVPASKNVVVPVFSISIIVLKAR